LLLGSRSLGAVLVEEGEDGHSLVLAKGLSELVDGRGDLQTLVQDGALTLDADILWPFHETTQVTALGTNVTTNSVVAGLGGVKRVRGLDSLGLVVLLVLLSFGSLRRKRTKSQSIVDQRRKGHGYKGCVSYHC
jgi:hypothetical protein